MRGGARAAGRKPTSPNGSASRRTPLITGSRARTFRTRRTFARLRASSRRTGTETGGANRHRVYHHINHGTPEYNDAIRTSVNDADTYTPTRVCRPREPIGTELLWDFTEGAVYHRYQGTFAARVTGASSVPDPTAEYIPKIQIGTVDTSADRVLHLYAVELAFYDRKKR